MMPNKLFFVADQTTAVIHERIMEGNGRNKKEVPDSAIYKWNYQSDRESGFVKTGTFEFTQKRIEQLISVNLLKVEYDSQDSKML